MPRYERQYRNRAYLSKAEVEPLRREVADLRERFALRELPVIRPDRPPEPAAQLALPLA